MAANSLDNQNVDEIDLTDLFKKAGRGISRIFSAIGNSVLFSILFMVKNWRPLILSIIAGAGFSYLTKIVLGPVYVSDLVLRTNGSTASEMVPYINKLHLYSIDGNFESLAGSLNISADAARRIRDINAYWIIDINKDRSPDYVDYLNDFNYSDTNVVKMYDRISIRVKTRSSDDFTLLRNGIISYVDNDSLFQYRNRVRFRQNSEILKRLSYDINLLDSLQKVKYFEETRNKIRGTSSQMVFLTEKKTKLFYDDIYDLYSRKHNLEVEVSLYKDIVTVISDFAKPFKPRTKTTFYAGFIIPVFFLITIIFLVVRRNKKSLGEVFDKI
jgi:hypothetical protein